MACRSLALAACALLFIGTAFAEDPTESLAGVVSYTRHA